MDVLLSSRRFVLSNMFMTDDLFSTHPIVAILFVMDPLVSFFRLFLTDVF